MQTCTEKVSLFGVVKSCNEYLQSLRSVTSLYKNMHLHGNLGYTYNINKSSLVTIMALISLPPCMFIFLTDHLAVYLKFKLDDLVVQTLRRSPSHRWRPEFTSRSPMWVSWWTKRVWVGFSQGLSSFPLS